MVLDNVKFQIQSVCGASVIMSSFILSIVSQELQRPGISNLNHEVAILLQGTLESSEGCGESNEARKVLVIPLLRVTATTQRPIFSRSHVQPSTASHQHANVSRVFAAVERQSTTRR